MKRTSVDELSTDRNNRRHHLDAAGHSSRSNGR
jgi:hypothetical protein